MATYKAKKVSKYKKSTELKIRLQVLYLAEQFDANMELDQSMSTNTSCKRL